MDEAKRNKILDMSYINFLNKQYKASMKIRNFEGEKEEGGNSIDSSLLSGQEVPDRSS